MVAPTSGDVVAFGCKKTEWPAFHIFKAGDFESPSKIDALCIDKNNINLLAISMNGKDQIVVSCDQCQNIWLIDLGNRKSNVIYDAIYDAGKCYPTIMCQDEVGNIYIRHKPSRGDSSLLILAREESSSKLKPEPIKVDTLLVEVRMAFVPLSPNYRVISSFFNQCFVRGIHADSGTTK